MIASFPDHAIATGHGRGSKGAISSSDPSRSVSLTVQPTASSRSSRPCAAVSRSAWHAASRQAIRRSVGDFITSATAGRTGRARRFIATIFRTCLCTCACALSPADQKPAGASAQTIAARPRRANSMAIHGEKHVTHPGGPHGVCGTGHPHRSARSPAAGHRPGWRQDRHDSQAEPHPRTKPGRRHHRRTPRQQPTPHRSHPTVDPRRVLRIRRHFHHRHRLRPAPF
jgi:hypothetical protein